MLTLDMFKKWFSLLAETYEKNKAYLTELDSAIGDADHGINLARGFSAVAAEINAKNPTEISSLLKIASMTLIKTVGGASGPLYGTFFMKMATVNAKDSMSFNDFVKGMEAGVDGISKLGKSTKGEKTMLDVWYPVLDSLKGSVNKNLSIKEAMQNAVKVAEKSADDTIPLIAQKGRASYLGERSIGHKDPGAASSVLMIEAAELSFS